MNESFAPARALLTVALLATSGFGQGAVLEPRGEATAAIEVVERDGIRYREDDDSHPRRNLLDLYLPESVKTPPLVMFVHGGAWMGGNKNGWRNVGTTFARAGIACAVINYRLSPRVQHPEHVEDCAVAFAWLRAHAGDHGYDRERMFVAGHSAGAHLVALLGLDGRYLAAHGLKTDSIRGVIPISAPFDVTPRHRIFQGVFGHDPAGRRDASPLHHVAVGAPPFLVLWAEHEMTGLAPMSQAMVARMRRQDLRVESAQVENRTHANIARRVGRQGDETTERMLKFVRGICTGLDEGPGK